MSDFKADFKAIPMSMLAERAIKSKPRDKNLIMTLTDVFHGEDRNLNNFRRGDDQFYVEFFFSIMFTERFEYEGVEFDVSVVTTGSLYTISRIVIGELIRIGAVDAEPDNQKKFDDTQVDGLKPSITLRKDFASTLTITPKSKWLYAGSLAGAEKETNTWWSGLGKQKIRKSEVTNPEYTNRENLYVDGILRKALLDDALRGEATLAVQDAFRKRMKARLEQ